MLVKIFAFSKKTTLPHATCTTSKQHVMSHSPEMIFNSRQITSRQEEAAVSLALSMYPNIVNSQVFRECVVCQWNPWRATINGKQQIESSNDGYAVYVT